MDTVFYSKLDFHPDGRLFGNFRLGGSDLGLALFDLNSGQTQPIVKAAKQARYALSPDGKTVAYTAAMDVDGQQWGNDGPQADIWQVAVAGGEPRKITRFPSRVYDLCWTANGKSLIIVSELGGVHNDLWQVPLDDPERGVHRAAISVAHVPRRTKLDAVQ